MCLVTSCPTRNTPISICVADEAASSSSPPAQHPSYAEEIYALDMEKYVRNAKQARSTRRIDESHVSVSSLMSLLRARLACAILFPHPRPHRASFQATALEADLSRATTANQPGRPSLVDTGARSGKRLSVPAAGAAIENAALAYGNPPTAVAFAEAFLRDEEAFFLTMDTVSHGRFLRFDDDTGGSASSTGGNAVACPSRKADAAPTPAAPDDPRPKRRDSSGGGGGKKGAGSSSRATAAGAAGLNGLSKRFLRNRGGVGRGGLVGGPGAEEGEGWKQSSWLKEMECFSLAAFLANR